jgi:hypothetical protein
MPASGNLALSPSTQNLTPLIWWRTRQPSVALWRRVEEISEALAGTEIHGEPDWLRAIQGDAVVAVRVAANQLKVCKIGAGEIDVALSAVLACALRGDPASAILISSALRRRSKRDSYCIRLSLLWLIAKF